MTDTPAQPAKATRFAFDNDFFEVSVTPSHSPAHTPMPNPAGRAPRNVQEAQQQGYEEGYNAAKAEFDATFAAERQAASDEAARQLTATLQALDTAQADWQEQVLKQTLALMRVSLHRLTGHAASHYPDQLLEMHLKSLMDEIRTHEDLTLRIAPSARAYHEKLGLAHASIHGRSFQIITDTALGPTDCLIEWRYGGLEARLAQHMQALDALLASLHVQILPVPELPQQPVAGAPATAAPVAESPAVPPAEPAPAAAIPPAAPMDAATSEARRRAEALLGDDELVDALK